MSDVNTLIERLEAAQARGAVGASVLESRSQGRRVRVADGRVVEDGPLSRSTMTVRVWLEGGRGGAATGDPDAFEALLDRAIAEAATAELDPYGGPTERLAGDPRGLGVLDHRYSTLTTGDRLDVVVQLERAARAVDRRIEVTPFDYEDHLTVRRYANTHGVAVEERSTFFQCAGGVRGPHGELQIDGSLGGRTFADVASLPMGASMARRVVALLKSTTTHAGPLRTMLTPDVVAAIFGALAPRIGREQTHFLQGGAAVDSRIHLLDDGVAPGGLYTRGFDDRGVRPVPVMLVREGRADGCFLDVPTARRRDRRPTGHETQGELRRSNLVLRGGSRSMNALMAEMSEPVLVLDHLSGFDEGIDWATGDLNCRCSGRIQRNGKSEGVVRHCTFTGNLRDALSRVVDLASDTDRIRGVDAPSICVDGLVVGES